MTDKLTQEAENILLSGMKRQKIFKSLPPHDSSCAFWCKHDSDVIIESIASALTARDAKHDKEVKELRDAIRKYLGFHRCPTHSMNEDQTNCKSCQKNHRVNQVGLGMVYAFDTTRSLQLTRKDEIE